MTFILIGCWMNPCSSHSQMNLALNLSVESNIPTASDIYIYTHQIIIIKLQIDRNEYPQGSCWFATFQPGTAIKLTGGTKIIHFSILNTPTLPVLLLYYHRKSTSFSTEGNLFGNHMALDVISGESSLMNTSNEVRLTERNIIFLA